MSKIKIYFGGAIIGTSKEGKPFKKVTLIVQRGENTDTYQFFVDDSVYAKCEGKPMFEEVDAVFMPGYQGRCNLEDITFSSSSAKAKATTSAEDFK